MAYIAAELAALWAAVTAAGPEKKRGRPGNGTTAADARAEVEVLVA